jgi:HAD superfamily hydrolase (TIGR01509 family)
MAIKALIFDFDGLILDTEVASYQVWQDIYRSYGLELTLDKWVHVIGTSFGVFDPFVDLQTKTGQAVDRQATMNFVIARMMKLMEGSQPLPGVLQTIQTARQMGLRLAVASSSVGSWVHTHLQKQGLEHYFDVICTRDDVTRVKPDPALYLLAVERLGVRPEEAAALEDSLNGILAAKAAGLRCIAIPNAVTAKMDFTVADIVLPSMRDLSLPTLIGRF